MVEFLFGGKWIVEENGISFLEKNPLEQLEQYDGSFMYSPFTLK